LYIVYTIFLCAAVLTVNKDDYLCFSTCSFVFFVFSSTIHIGEIIQYFVGTDDANL